MGRAAKYLTQEERLAARRALRAQRDSKPGAKERRQRQNRRAWRKKTKKQLLKKDAPEVPPGIRKQASIDLSNEENIALYTQFCQGRDTIEFEGEFNVDGDKFDNLIGPGPYPTAITSSPNFSEHWPKLCSALHGVMAYRYLQYCDDIMLRCQKYPEWHIHSGLTSTYNELAVEYNKTTISAQRHFEEGNKAETSIATQNGRWISRMMVYTVEDMLCVKEGRERLLARVCDRRWHIRHGLRL